MYVRTTAMLCLISNTDEASLNLRMVLLCVSLIVAWQSTWKYSPDFNLRTINFDRVIDRL